VQLPINSERKHDLAQLCASLQDHNTNTSLNYRYCTAMFGYWKGTQTEGWNIDRDRRHTHGEPARWRSWTFLIYICFLGLLASVTDGS